VRAFSAKEYSQGEEGAQSTGRHVADVAREQKSGRSLRTRERRGTETAAIGSRRSAEPDPYAQVATMRSCQDGAGAGPYGSEVLVTTKSAHSFSV
jgi:hypothetical protein